MVEQVIETEAAAGRRKSVSVTTSRPVRLREVESDGLDRLALPVQEFSRVLGGGWIARTGLERPAAGRPFESKVRS